MKIAVNGCGRVGRALLSHLAAQNEDIQVTFLGRSKNQWKRSSGLPITELPSLEDFDFINGDFEEIEAILETCPIDIWFELTPTLISSGKEVNERIVKILSKGVSVIFANKSPVLYDYQILKEVCERTEAKMGFSAIMGGALPSFALSHYGTMGSKVLKMRGILNGTSNFILALMENGITFEEAIKESIVKGIAEPNWSNDVDGIDSSVKMTIIASILSGKNTELKEEDICGIRQISMKQIETAKLKNQRYKLVATFEKGRVSVKPELVSADNILYHINGPEKILQIVTDTLSEMSVIGGKSGLMEVAASMYRDLVWMQN